MTVIKGIKAIGKRVSRSFALFSDVIVDWIPLFYWNEHLIQKKKVQT